MDVSIYRTVIGIDISHWRGGGFGHAPMLREGTWVDPGTLGELLHVLEGVERPGERTHSGVA